MVNKDSSEKETSEKKRRKTSSTDVGSSKQPKEDIYENVIKHEEQEAQKRSAEKDMTMFHQTCSQLKKIFEEIATLKKDNSENGKYEIQEKRIQGSLIFVILKKLNRLDKIRLRAGRDALHKEKLRVDSNRLQLQNLLYESNHLQREIERCYQFKSQDEEIELVSEKEFYEKAPQSISRPDATRTDEHARRLARLEWELQQRKELSVLCKELTISKEIVSNDIALKTERLEFLAPGLDALLKATRPLQKALEMEIEKEWDVQKSMRLLSRPLYLAYANLSAYKEACEPKLLSVIIEGDEEEAKQLVEDEEKNEPQNNEEDDNQESDNDDNEVETRKKHHAHKRLSKAETIEYKQKNMLKPHPLNVTFELKRSTGDNSISVSLRYFPLLGFVTAKATVSVESVGVAASDVISSENILNSLYTEDLGHKSPNLRTGFQISNCSMTEEKLLELFVEKGFGKPYKWAQRLCGLQFTEITPCLSSNQDKMATASTSTNNGIEKSSLIDISHELVHETVPTIINLIKTRWYSRLRLFKQIHSLENKNIDLTTGSENSIPLRISSSLVQWTSITWEDYSANLMTQRFIDENLTNEHNLYYRAIVTRGSAKLECLISISSNFPIESPIWALSLSWNGKHDATNNSAIRDIEYWVNSTVIPKNASMILVEQLRKVMSCLDIFLETEGPLYRPAEFTQDKMFFKPYKGRNRARPYKVIQNGTSIIYKQI